MMNNTLDHRPFKEQIGAWLKVMTDKKVIEVEADDDDLPWEEKKTWGMSDLPHFKGKKALVLGGAFFASGVQLMAMVGFGKAETVEEADLVVFMGGSDVDPSVYGQVKLPCTSSHPARDEFEINVFNKCVELGIPMFGICRGAQLLHVLNKDSEGKCGQLWQDVNNHAGNDHMIYDIEEDIYVMANSYHHQMICLNDTMDLIACCSDQVATRFKSDSMDINLLREGQNQNTEVEVEAGAYWKTKCFFVQGHPEVSNPEYRSWCMYKLSEFLDELAEDDVPNTDGDDANEVQQEVLDPQVATELKRAGLMD